MRRPRADGLPDRERSTSACHQAPVARVRFHVRHRRHPRRAAGCPITSNLRCRSRLKPLPRSGRATLHRADARPERSSSASVKPLGRHCASTASRCSWSTAARRTTTIVVVRRARRIGSSHRPFDNMSAQLNWGIDQLATEYVLVIDADEIMSPELRRRTIAGHRAMAVDGRGSPTDRLLRRALARPLPATASPILPARIAGATRTRSTSASCSSIADPLVVELVGPLAHPSHLDVSGFIAKLNRYTDGEHAARPRSHSSDRAARVRGVPSKAIAMFMPLVLRARRLARRTRTASSTPCTWRCIASRSGRRLRPRSRSSRPPAKRRSPLGGPQARAAARLCTAARLSGLHGRRQSRTVRAHDAQRRGPGSDAGGRRSRTAASRASLPRSPAYPYFTCAQPVRPGRTRWRRS